MIGQNFRSAGYANLLAGVIGGRCHRWLSHELSHRRRKIQVRRQTVPLLVVSLLSNKPSFASQLIAYFLFNTDRPYEWICRPCIHFNTYISYTTVLLHEVCIYCAVQYAISMNLSNCTVVTGRTKRVALQTHYE